jgi:hypothetical protein
MSAQYVETQSPRFVVETIGGHEQIVVGAQRNLFLMLFLPVWLCGWTFGGVMALNTLLKSFQPFLLIWLCGWAVGEAFVIATLCWMFFGKEILRVVGTDLEIGYSILGFTRRKLFRGSAIRDLTSCDPPPLVRYNQPSLPFLTGTKTGSVKFAYGARTIYAAQGLDRPEGRLIVERLRKRLPSTATVQDDA